MRMQELSERPSSAIRKSIEEVPHHHEGLKSRVMYLKSQQGQAFEIRFNDNTTNSQSIIKLERRLEDAATARREGRPLGQYTSSGIDLPKKASIDVIGNVAGNPYRIAISYEGNNVYKVNGQYETSLKSAVRAVAQQADMELVAVQNSRNSHQPSAPSYGRRM